MESKLWALWPGDQADMKNHCRKVIEKASAVGPFEWEQIYRDQVSHSFRAKTDAQSGRPVWMLIDVVLSEVEPWWLSVCFYADTITDPDERGEIIPQGLLGEDGYCFDLIQPEPDMVEYLQQRMSQAYGVLGGN